MAHAITVKTEIPHREWSVFLENFSREHQGWLVRIEPRGAGSSNTAQFNGLPLEALTIQLDGDEETVSVMVRNDKTAHRHTLHTIAHPKRIQVEEPAGTNDKRVHVDSREARTVVALQAVPLKTQDQNSGVKQEP